jgi:ribosomal protein S1
VEHPSDLFKVGDEIDVKVIDIDIERERVSLDRKSLLPSPWDKFAEKHASGKTMEGQVTNVLDFGAFVELEEGIEGLVHVSEIGYSTSGNPKDVVKPGDRVLVQILDINPERERISLSMRQVPLEQQIAWSMENAKKEERSSVEEKTTEVKAQIQAKASSTQEEE